MKRKDLLDLFYQNGWRFLREGGSHTIITNGKTTESVPRHQEVSELLARKLIRYWNLKKK